MPFPKFLLLKKCSWEIRRSKRKNRIILLRKHSRFTINFRDESLFSVNVRDLGFNRAVRVPLPPESVNLPVHVGDLELQLPALVPNPEKPVLDAVSVHNLTLLLPTRIPHFVETVELSVHE